MESAALPDPSKGPMRSDRQTEHARPTAGALARRSVLPGHGSAVTRTKQAIARVLKAGAQRRRQRRRIIARQIVSHAGRCAGTVLPARRAQGRRFRASTVNHVPRVRAERERLNETLRKLTKGWIENLVGEADYERHKTQVEFDLTALVVSEAGMVAEACPICGPRPMSPSSVSSC